MRHVLDSPFLHVARLDLEPEFELTALEWLDDEFVPGPGGTSGAYNRSLCRSAPVCLIVRAPGLLV